MRVGLITFFSVFSAAKEVLEKGCTPVFKEGTGAFHLQDFVHKPARVPANIQSGSCITWALTQPRANLQAVVDSARGDGAVPTVAIHVRTGYVDVIARPREKVVWDRLECPADDGRGPLDGHDELRRRRLAAVDAGALVATPAGRRGGNQTVAFEMHVLVERACS